jgi:hypothetical protein
VNENIDDSDEVTRGSEPKATSRRALDFSQVLESLTERHAAVQHRQYLPLSLPQVNSASASPDPRIVVAVIDG